jgi:hypothetical protein
LNVSPNSTDFELMIRMLSKFESKGGRTLEEFVLTSINSPVHKHGQGVLHDGLETLLFDMGDMHRPTLNMVEDMEFERELSVKQILKILV